MKCFEVADSATVRFIANLHERLVGSQQFIEHIAKIWLLFANAHVDFIVSAGSIDGISIKRIAYCMVPILELELTLERYSVNIRHG